MYAVPPSLPAGSEWVLLILAVLLYLFPSIVARYREHHNATAIFLLNLFLGWSILGWIGALVWSATRVIRDPASPVKGAS